MPGRKILATIAVLCSTPVAAQPDLSRIEEVAAPALPPSIPLGTAKAKNMPQESWTASPDGSMVRNVAEATLTPILPDPAKSTGAAVIVAPGGAFHGLAMETEGVAVARALADRGVAAFVLKYRVLPTPSNTSDYLIFLGERIRRARAGELDLQVPENSLEDTQVAFQVIRSRAEEWRIDPARLGMMGFSAGAMLTIEYATKADAEKMPAFIAPIYGMMRAMPVPKTAPPLFAALAADDPLFGAQGYGLAEAWRAAGKPVELHVYQAGGHGYGLGRPGTTTVGWIDDFIRWLDLNRLLAGAAPRGPATE